MDNDYRYGPKMYPYPNQGYPSVESHEGYYNYLG